MPFSTDLDNYSYSADPDPCNECCAANQTPEKMFLCFSGIQIGALWNPVDPPPPYGSYQLSHVGFCNWRLITADYTFDYQTVPDFSDVFVTTPGFDQPFWKRHVGICHNWWENFHQVPAGNKWYGGHCILINTLPGGISDITDLMQLMSDSPDWADWLGSVPTAADTGSYQFSRHLDHTNVRILMDVP